MGAEVLLNESMPDAPYPQQIVLQLELIVRVSAVAPVDH